MFDDRFKDIILFSEFFANLKQLGKSLGVKSFNLVALVGTLNRFEVIRESKESL